MIKEGGNDGGAIEWWRVMGERGVGSKGGEE